MKIDSCLDAGGKWNYDKCYCKKGDNEPYQFVSNIYTNYSDGNLLSYSPFENPDTIFSPQLLNLIKLDEKYANGEAGFLDWDPICDCQDFGNFTLKKIEIKKTDNKVIANVSFQISETSVKVVLYLIKIDNKWFIDDIKSKDNPSLYKYLKKNLQKVHMLPEKENK